MSDKIFLYFTIYINCSRMKGGYGEVSEWLKVQTWKVCVGAIPPRVRIPPSLFFCFCLIFLNQKLRYYYGLTGIFGWPDWDWRSVWEYFWRGAYSLKIYGRKFIDNDISNYSPMDFNWTQNEKFLMAENQL